MLRRAPRFDRQRGRICNQRRTRCRLGVLFASPFGQSLLDDLPVHLVLLLQDIVSLLDFLQLACELNLAGGCFQCFAFRSSRLCMESRDGAMVPAAEQ